MWTLAEIASHNSRESCWVIIGGQVYDVTEFLPEHPGGEQVVLAWAGKDATEEYAATHPPGTIERELPLQKKLGAVASSTFNNRTENLAKTQAPSTDKIKDINYCLNLRDFELLARSVLSQRAWIYYSSASDDLRSHNLNLNDWAHILLRPRVLNNVLRVDMSCSILGQQSRLPVFIAPTALARLGHADGELCLVRGAAHHGIPYIAAMASSVSSEDVIACSQQLGSVLQYQLYVKKKRKEAREIVRKARDLGFKALVVTVDTAVIGKREEDDRYRLESGTMSFASSQTVPSKKTLSDEDVQVLRGPYSSTLNWEDLKWIREEWGDAGPISLKGIMTAEDAKLAAEAGITSIYLSNHGGRQLDGSPSSLRTLLEIRKYCPEVLERCEVLLDGGVRRGSDVLKALCLGARGVGLGRPFLYALSAYGTEGVIRAIQILSDEIETSMRLLGVTSISQLKPHLVNAETLEQSVSKNLRQYNAHL